MDQKIFNINSATLEELNTLPEMSSDLAQLIQAGRPYTAVEEIKRIQGVSGKLYKKWLPHLTVNGNTAAVESGSSTQKTTSPEEPVQVEYADVPVAISSPVPIQRQDESPETPQISPASEISQTGSTSELPSALPVEKLVEPAANLPLPADVAPKPVPVIEPVPSSFVPAAQPVTKEITPQVYVTRTQAVLLAFLSSGLTLILTVAVTLLLLFVINGALQFAPLTDFNRLDNQVTQLGSQANGLEQSIQAVQDRLKVVDELSAQVSGMEGEVAGLKQDVQSAQAAVKEIAGNVDKLSQDVDTLTAQVNVFQKFLAGLRSLLNGLSSPVNP